MTTDWDQTACRRRIILHQTDDRMLEYNHNTRDVFNSTVKVVGAFAEEEVLGMLSAFSEHTKHVDHGWVVRYVLLFNGVKLAEKLLKSNSYGQIGAPLSDGARRMGRFETQIHKAAHKHGIKRVPQVGGL